MVPALQAKLLRFLEEKAFKRVGGAQDIRVDVRVIAATNRNLEDTVRQGTFREDLYYRLNVIPVTLPPLRERREDIPLLAAHFARKLLGDAARAGLPPDTLDALFGELTRHDWPGNVRELRNVVERALILADPELLGAGALEVAAGELQRSIEKAVHKQHSLRAARAEHEREYLTELLAHTEGDLDAAAAIAQIHRKSLERLLRRLKLRARPPDGGTDEPAPAG
jgi:transcriptional regulator with PAS, ATPase and Fis domain